MIFRQAIRNVADVLKGMAYSRYETRLREQAVELNDLFLLLVYLEGVGLPNPAMAYLLEVYPMLLDEFHLWHRRMGIDRSPLSSFSCC